MDGEVSEILEENILVQDSLLVQVEKLLECKLNQSSLNYEMLVKWKGFSDEENSWEPFENLLVDVPRMVKDFVVSLRSGSMKDDLKMIMRGEV